MANTGPVRCRVAACREDLHDGNAWSFYLINDSDHPFDLAVLHEVGYEWGDTGNSEPADVRVADLAPGAHALLWRDDGSGAELRMALALSVRMGGRDVRLGFEFPRLYKLTNLPVIDGLGKPGYVVAAEKA